MIKFPLHFTLTAQARSGISAQWSCKNESLPPIPCAIPHEFGGPGRGYSPEDLFAFAVVNCIIATFKVYCEKSNLQFSEITSKAQLGVDRHPTEKTLWMSTLDITIHVSGSSDPEKVKATLQRSIADCAVSNSIKTQKTFHLTVE